MNGISKYITGLWGNDASPETVVSGRSVTLEHPGLWNRVDHG